MIGVRRTSRIVRSDAMRGLFVVAALVAVGVGYRGHDGLQGAGKSKPDAKFIDPFLAEDVAAPGDNEIPIMPDVDPAPSGKKAAPFKRAGGSRKPSKPTVDTSISDELPDTDLPISNLPDTSLPGTTGASNRKAPKRSPAVDVSDDSLTLDADSAPVSAPKASAPPTTASPAPKATSTGTPEDGLPKDGLPEDIPQKKSAVAAPRAKPAKARDLIPDLDDIPTVQAPRLNREIKNTTAPKFEADPELDVDSDADSPAGSKTQPKLRSLKNFPTLGKPGLADADPEKLDWKSTEPAPAESSKAAADTPRGFPGKVPGKAPGAPVGPPSEESARFEQSGNIQDLNEPIEKIIIEGNKTIKTEEILKLLKTRPGRIADQKTIKEDVRTLVSKRWFFDVEPRIAQSKDGPGKVLVFRVSERPMLKKITYIGNKKVKDKALNEVITLKVNGGYDVGQNREAVHRILSLYHEKGYQHATVELEKGDSNEDREVVFKIDEGPKVVVNKITFSGNSYFSTPVLKTQIKTKKVILWWFGGKFDKMSVDEDVDSLRKYYHSLGFFDVKVAEKICESADKSKIHVEYIIEEGVRFKVRNIEFVGSRVIPDEKLRKDLQVLPGQYFAQRFVDADKNKIVAQYGELGRIKAKVEPRVRSFEEPGYVDLVYDIDESRPYRIGRIHVRINGDHPHTKESAVLTKLTFKPGELASQAKIDKSKQRLKACGLFAGGQPGPMQQNQQNASPPEIVLKESELPTPRQIKTQGKINLVRGQEESTDVSPRRAGRKPEPVSNDDLNLARGQNPANPPSDSLPFGDSQEGPPPEDPYEETPYLDAIVNVFETQTGRLNMGVGINSNVGLQGNITLEENNFDILKPPTSFQDIVDGTAWRGGGQQFRIEAMPGIQFSRYLVSWRDPFFLDQNVMLGVSGYYNNRYFINWTERREGGRVNLGHQFNPNFSGTLGLRAEGVNISNPSVPVPPDYLLVLGQNFLSTAQAALVYDTRDFPMMPGKGYYVQGSFEQGIANFVYQRYDLDARQHFLIKERPDGGSRHILSLYGNVGWITSEAPFFERFFGGGFGQSTFRGFQYQGVGPRDQGVRIGGQFQALGTVEYQIPITADNAIQVVAFTDLGTVDSTATFANYRQSVGIGLRLSVPMLGPVPIAIDFGVPIRHTPYDSLNLVTFNMGAAR